MDALLQQRRSEVFNAWKEKYEQQRSGGILKWPEEMSAAFRKKVTEPQFTPIERFPFDATGTDTAIPTFMRDDFGIHVTKELPKLAQIIGAKWTFATDTRGMRVADEEPGRGRGMIDTSVIVHWDPQDQSRITTEHFQWAGRAGTPSSWDVLYAQEDLWVLRAIMEIIKATNGDAMVRHNAAIKEIEFLRLGKSAVEGGAKIWRREATTGEETSAYVEPEGPSEQVEEGDMIQIRRVDPADGRYVNRDYGALTGTELRQLLDSTSPDDAYLRVAKRMPVRLRVKMDQRSMTQLLVACANSNLTLEVRQLSLNPSSSADTGTTRRGMPRNPFGLDEGAMGSMFMSGREMNYADRLRSQSGGSLDANAFPNDLSVEVYGLIYIYNEPDPNVLGGAGEGDQPSGGSSFEDEDDTDVATDARGRRTLAVRQPLGSDGSA
jgi:hypothetical protein